MDDVLKDKRFSHVVSDPRFRQVPPTERKVKIDKRFQAMFKDQRFKLKYSVDKRGRPVCTSTNENLRRFYDISDESVSSSEDSDVDNILARENIDTREKPMKKAHTKNLGTARRKGEPKISKKTGEKKVEDEEDMDAISVSAEKLKVKLKVKTQPLSASEIKENEKKLQRVCLEDENIEDEVSKADEGSAQEGSDEEGEDDAESGLGSGPDYARGFGNTESSSEDSDVGSDDDGVDFEEQYVHDWGELDKDIPEAIELGRRLAVCNMDWDHIKAQDLFMLCNSFKPPDGIIHSVSIYPSEYGLQRMEEEKIKGPPELVDETLQEEEENLEETTEGSHYHMEKLRQYQLNRLRYYYAVVECDTADTANHIYEELDGSEYESCKTRLDLRFVPDEMTFEHPPKMVCTELPDAASYKPTLFENSALSEAQVSLTWDETDRDRAVASAKKLSKDKIKEMDFQAYLASSSDEGDPYHGFIDQSDCSEEEEKEEDKIKKYQQLLLNIEGAERKNQNEGMEMDMEVTWEPGLKEMTEEIVKKKQKNKMVTPWVEYLEKRKEKIKKKKVERKRRITGEKSKMSETEDIPFSDDEFVADIDLNDPYFKDALPELSVKKSGLGKSEKKAQKKKEKLTDAELEAKKQREAELTLLMMDENDRRHHFNFHNLIEDEAKKKKPLKKRESEIEDTFLMNVKDKRFEALFTSNLYNIDTSAPEFKRTKGTEALINEKLQRRKRNMEELDPTDAVSSKRKADTTSEFGRNTKISRTEVAPSSSQSLQSLVKSVKAKTLNYYRSKKKC